MRIRTSRRRYERPCAASRIRALRTPIPVFMRVRRYPAIGVARGVEPPPADSKLVAWLRPAEIHRDESRVLEPFRPEHGHSDHGLSRRSGGPTVAPRQDAGTCARVVRAEAYVLVPWQFLLKSNGAPLVCGQGDCRARSAPRRCPSRRVVAAAFAEYSVERRKGERPSF
jgi:hypothetical protein